MQQHCSFLCQSPCVCCIGCKHLSAVELHHAFFTPFVKSFDGTLGHEALMFLQHLDDRLSGAWGKNYSDALLWIKVHLAFAVVWVTNLCFHGSRVHWQSGTSIDNGTGIPHVSLAEVFFKSV